jgi:hypothetical protein
MEIAFENVPRDTIGFFLASSGHLDTQDFNDGLVLAGDANLNI